LLIKFIVCWAVGFTAVEPPPRPAVSRLDGISVVELFAAGVFEKLAGIELLFTGLNPLAFALVVEIGFLLLAAWIPLRVVVFTAIT
jgi:hypothetical protein